MNPKVIIIDGKTYHSIDEMPPDIRQKYEKLIHTLRDRDPNSFPDTLEEVDVLAEVNKSLEKIMADRLKDATNKVHGLDALSPEQRDQVEQVMQKLDPDKNGIPDIFENIATSQAVVNSMKVIVNGKEFNGLFYEDLPPEARAKYQEAMGKLDANQNGIPDFVEGMINATNQTANIATNFGVETPRRSTPLPVTPTIAPDTSNGWGLALAGLFILLFCAVGAAGVWYFFLR